MNAKILVFPVSGSSALKARAEVTLLLEDGKEVVLRDFRIIQKDLDAPWVAVPQVSYLKNGKLQYKDIIRLNQKAKADIGDQILNEYKKKIKSS